MRAPSLRAHSAGRGRPGRAVRRPGCVGAAGYAGAGRRSRPAASTRCGRDTLRHRRHRIAHRLQRLYRADPDDRHRRRADRQERAAQHLHDDPAIALAPGIDRRDDRHQQHVELPVGPQVARQARRPRHRRRVGFLWLGGGRRRGQFRHRQAVRRVQGERTWRGHHDGAVASCYIGFCVDGDLSGNVSIGTTLQSEIERINGYTRVGYDIAPDNEVYATVNIAQVNTSNQPNPGAARSGLTLSCANAYVPASIVAACAANGITSFQYGVSNAILPNSKVSPSREQYRFVGGATGNVAAFGTNWTYDAYYEHGVDITDINVDNISLTPRYNQAIQAITLNGQIVCAIAVARASGCLPINIIAGTAPSPAALAYIEPANRPLQHTRQTQDVFSANVSGEPLSLWAGPVSVATGVEYRREAYHLTGDP